MRALRVLGLVLAVVAAGLLSGGTAGAAPATTAVMAAAAGGPSAVTALGPAPVVVPAARRTVPGTPCVAAARACIDLSANRAWLIRNGAVQYGPVPVTHGRRGYRTPPGTFRVTFKSRHHVSSIYGSPMPYSVFFNGGIAFHQGSLNQRSHGCIHLSRSAARTFFASLRPGDVVQVAR